MQHAQSVERLCGLLARYDPSDPLLPLLVPLNGNSAKAHTGTYLRPGFQEPRRDSRARILGTMDALAALARAVRPFCDLERVSEPPWLRLERVRAWIAEIDDMRTRREFSSRFEVMAADFAPLPDPDHYVAPERPRPGRTR